jgi:hypothetical protein
MQVKTLFLATLCSVAALTLLVTNSCTKNTAPPPVHDTTVVIKTDTLTVPPPPDPTVNLRKGLLLWLPFDGNMADSSGNGNPTSPLNGASLTYDEHGYANNAFGAAGTNQVILVTNNGSIKFDTAYSISLNFMTLDSSSLHCYLSMVNWADGYGPSFAIGTTVPGYSNFDVGVNDISAGCDNYGTTNPNKLNDTTVFKPLIQSWYNAIIVYHRGSVTTYINGNQVSTKKGTGTLANLCSASNIVVGGWWTPTPENINGKVDDIRIYNRVLTPHEIALLAKRFQDYP